MARSQTGGSGYSGSSGSSTPIGAPPITMACWVQVASLAATYDAMVLQRGEADTNYCRLGVNTGGVAFTNTANDGSSSTYAQSSTTIAAINTWAHIATVHNGTTRHNAYLNGGGKGSDATNSNFSSGGGPITRINLGAYFTDPAGVLTALNGRIADCAIWNVELTDDEILSLAKGAHPRTIRPANLVFYAPLSGDRDPELDIVGGLSLTTLASAKAESQPGLIRGGRR